LRNQKYRVSK